MGKITCTGCRKCWSSKDEFENDNVKCGKDTCQCLSEAQKAQLSKQVAKPAEPRPNIRITSIHTETKKKHGNNFTVKILSGTVDDPFDKVRGKEPAYYEDVPKVVMYEIRKAA